MTYEDARPLHTGKVEGSIPSVPTIATLDNQRVSANSASDDLTQTDGTVREHDAPGRGAGVEVCSTSVPSTHVNGIPFEIKAFERWMTQQWLGWPIELFQAGLRALHALIARSDEDWLQNYPKRYKAKADWSAFTTAYAEWRAA